MSAVPDLKRFWTMPADEAEAHYRQYVESNSDRADEFVRAVGAAGGPALDYAEESLVPLWGWVLEQIVPRRSLFGRGGTEQVLDDEELVEGLGAYLAEVALRHVPDSRWIHWRNAEDDIDYNQPLVVLYGNEGRAENFLRDALNMVSLARQRERERQPAALLELYRRWTKPPPRPLGA
jgi:hypothetical protein